MIRVKAFKVREMFFKFSFYVLLLLGIYFFFIFFLSFIRISSKSYAMGIFDENINSDEVFKRNELNVNLLKNELFLEEKIKKSSYTYSENIEYSDVNKDNKVINPIEIVEDESKFLSYEEVEFKNRPIKYDVEELASGKIRVGKAYINNYSKLKLNLNELSKVSNYKIDDSTKILIFHTHTSEAYEEIGTASNFRSTDDKYNVVAVGNTLKENLLLKKFDTYHCITKHDTPSYNGAYNASLKTVQDILKQKKYNIIIDIHRDALSGNLHFRPTSQINGETAAKLMFVVGTNASGLEHPNWMNNLKLALLIQNTAEEMYPGLFRDLNLSKSRYNQHISDGAFIIEVGSTGNTLSDTKIAMKYLANVLSALKEGE